MRRRPSRPAAKPKRSGKPARPRTTATPRVLPPSREVRFPAPAPARIGEWLFTTRPEAEVDLLDELTLPPFTVEPAKLPRQAGPSLVAVPSMPRERPELAFARQGFPVAAIVPVGADAVGRLAQALLLALSQAQSRKQRETGPQP